MKLPVEVTMIELKQIANTAAIFSKNSKIHAIAASPIAAIAVLGIKTDECIKDMSKVFNGRTYKTKDSRTPTK